MEQCQHYIGIACARCGDWADDIIRDLEAQVREAREKAEPQARPGWHAFDEACTCSLCRSRAAHLNGCTCVLCATATPPSPETNS